MTEPELLGARRVRELLERYEVRPTKSLGQNFVVDPNTIRKVLAVADVAPADHVLEIGPGAGSLTVALAGAARRITAVEVDPQLVRVLRESTADITNLEIVEADALRYLFEATGADAVVANLPYNIAATLVLDILERAPSVRCLTVMTQKEVGERLAAAPGSKAYGLPSLVVSFYASARVAATISRNAFWPVPNVDSVVVRIDRRDLPDVDPRRFLMVARAAFSQRRKTLRRCLTPLAGSLDAATAAIEAARVPADARAEELGVDAFVAITAALPARAFA